jgi:hypothetical protein
VDRILYKNIIATITYYDVLDYPLTSFEIWKYLIRHSSDNSNKIWELSSVIEAMGSKHVRKYIAQKNGLYFLAGRDILINYRRSREYISFIKMKKLQKIVSILRISPFVRTICVTGRLSYYNCEKDSDLDVLIVYKYGHIWVGRFMMVALTQILGVRRYGNKTNNRICLNYHITTESLTVPTQDIFAAHEYTFIIPVFDTGYFEEFCEKNKWIKSFKPHHKCPTIKHELTASDNFFTKNIRKFFEIIYSSKLIERRLRKLQYNKIKKNPKTYKEGSLIMCNNEHLVFLPSPHGPKVFSEYKKRLETLEIDF